VPVYEYEHLDGICEWGKIFEFKQSIHDDPLDACPNCKGPVRKIISKINVSTPKTNSELRDQGFTKLVRRDNGVYENVTAREGESKIMYRDKPGTYPHLKKTIAD